MHAAQVEVCSKLLQINEKRDGVRELRALASHRAGDMETYRKVRHTDMVTQCVFDVMALDFFIVRIEARASFGRPGLLSALPLRC